MTDFELIDGDLVFVDGELEITDEDLPIVRRALHTPAGRLSMLEFGRAGFVRDGEFGNEIFNELSEPFSPGFLSLVRQHCQEAVDLVSEGVSVETPIASLSDPHTVSVDVFHNLDSTPLTLSL